MLSYLHAQHPPIIVRDLKPGNIMVTPEGDVFLIDFGIARTYKAGKQSNTENLGTAIYASPEHHGHGQTDARSDIYSLGATMYHLLTNVEPAPMETPRPGIVAPPCARPQRGHRAADYPRDGTRSRAPLPRCRGDAPGHARCAAGPTAHPPAQPDTSCQGRRL